jgi:type I restriction enzyme S subunit
VPVQTIITTFHLLLDGGSTEMKHTHIIYGIQAAVAHMTDSSVGIPILTNVNMTLEGKLDFTTLRYYELSKKQQEKRLQRGDVLFNWRSGSPHHVGKI